MKESRKQGNLKPVTKSEDLKKQEVSQEQIVPESGHFDKEVPQEPIDSESTQEVPTSDPKNDGTQEADKELEALALAEAKAKEEAARAVREKAEADRKASEEAALAEAKAKEEAAAKADAHTLIKKELELRKSRAKSGLSALQAELARRTGSKVKGHLSVAQEVLRRKTYR